MNTFRKRILVKLSQTTELPTAEVAETKTVSGSPPTFVATDQYPSIITGFQAKNTPWINGVANVINTALYYSSNGQVHLPWMRSNNFNFGTDQAPSIELKNLMSLSQLLYKTIFTNMGQPYKQALSEEDIKKKADQLYNSQVLNTLPATNATGQLATKVGGNVKDLIKTHLQQIR